MERVKAATDDRGRSADVMQALLLEYDAADFRGRHDLLEREGLTIRDVARWRRELARQVADGELPKRAATKNTAAAKKSAATKSDGPAVLDEVAEPAAAAPAANAPKSPPAARRNPEPATSPSSAAGRLSALRSDVVAAHASALVYHADALARLIADAPGADGPRRRSNSIERLAAAARETSAAAHEVLSARRRSGATDAPPRDSVNVSAELTDMLTQLSDYSSLAVAVQLLARELAPDDDKAVPGRRRAQGGDRSRRPWWGGEDADAPPGDARRERRTWGSRRGDE